MAGPIGKLTPIDDDVPVGKLTPIEEVEQPVGKLTPIDVLPTQWTPPEKPSIFDGDQNGNIISRALYSLNHPYHPPGEVNNPNMTLEEAFKHVKAIDEKDTAELQKTKTDTIDKIVSAPFSPLAPYVSPKTQEVGKGVAQSISENVAGLLSPENAQVMGGLSTPLAPLILAKELPKMGYGTVKSGVNAVQNWDTAGTQQNTANVLNTAIAALATLGMGKGLAGGEVAPIEPLEAPTPPPIKTPMELPEGFRGKVSLDAPKPEMPVTPGSGTEAALRFQSRNAPPVEINPAVSPGEPPTLFGPSGESLFSAGDNKFTTPLPEKLILPNEPTSLANSPIEIPEELGGNKKYSGAEESARLDAELAGFQKMIQDSVMQKKLPGPGETAHPAIPLPSSMEQAKLGDQFANPPQAPTQPQLPAAGQTAIPLPPPGGLPPTMELPTTFNRFNKQAIVRPENMSTIDLIKDAFGGSGIGALGDIRGIKERLPEHLKLKNENATLAQKELLRRATVIASQTGESVENVFGRMVMDPNYRPQTAQSGLVDPQGRPLNAGLPEAFTPSKKMAVQSLAPEMVKTGLLDVDGNPTYSQRLPEQFTTTRKASSDPLTKIIEQAKIKEAKVAEKQAASEDSFVKASDTPDYEFTPDGEKIRQWGRQNTKFKEGQMEGARGVKNFLASKSSEVMRRSGPAGKLFMDLIDQASWQGMDQTGSWIAPYMKVIKNLTDEGFSKNVIDALQGKEGVRATAEEFAAANQIRALLDDAGNKAEVAIPGFKKIENYFPQKGTAAFKKKLASEAGIDWYKTWLKKNFPDLKTEHIDEIVQKVRTNEDLGNFYNYVTEKASDSTAKYGNLYKKRRGFIPEEYLRKDKAVLAEYFSNAAEQIAENTYLGENLSKLDSLLPQIKNLADREYGSQILDNLKSEGKPVHGIDAAFRAVNNQSTFMLSFLSPIRNFFQRGNLLGVKGGNLIDVLKSFGSSYTKAGKEFALESGITSESTGKALARRANIEGGGVASMHHRFILMEATEHGNRVASANLGKRIAEKTLRKVIKKPDPFSEQVLSEMGINVKAAKARGYLTKEDLSSAAFQVVKSTQGLFRKVDTPNWFTKTEGTKLFSKFRSAAHLQTDFTYNVMKEFLRPSNRGKTALNTVLVLAWMEGTGALGNALSSTLRRKDYEYKPGEGLLASGVGLGGDLAKQAFGNSGKYLPTSLLGPTVGSAVSELQAIASKKPREILRPLLTHIPFIGSTLTPLLLSKKQK